MFGVKILLFWSQTNFKKSKSYGKIFFALNNIHYNDIKSWCDFTKKDSWIFIFIKYYKIFHSGPSVQLFCFQVLLWKTMQGKQEIKARTEDIRKIWTSHKIYNFSVNTQQKRPNSFLQTILDLHNKSNGLFKIEFLPKTLIF